MTTTDPARPSDDPTHAGDAGQGPYSDTGGASSGTPPAETTGRSQRGDGSGSTNHTGLTPDSIPVD